MNDTGTSKKRRLPGACDVCRKRKIKCNSGEMLGNTCTYCLTFKFECTHTPRKNELAAQKEYIKYLEGRMAELEDLIQTLHPGENLLEKLDSQHNVGPQKASKPVSFPELPYPAPRPPRSNESMSTSPIDLNSDAAQDDEDEDLAHIALAAHLNQLELETIEDKFFGQSSAFMLIQHAMKAKHQYLGRTEPNNGRDFRRPIYWDIRPWERTFMTRDIPCYIFPDIDLLSTLVAAFFDQVNTHMPLLHRPTFERNLIEHLHYRDQGFGATVMLVCAVASKYTNDPRVLAPGDAFQLSAGWQYFIQVPIVRKYNLNKADVHDIQYYCLATMYMLGTSLPNASWTFLGLGIRFAQERGMHRRKAKGQKLTMEDELWKRAFWFLISFDRFTSSFLGRPPSVQDEDFDIDVLVECDDAYWESDDPQMTFKQPPGKPSYVSSYCAFLRICEILAFSMRTLYSTKKAKVWSGHIGNVWEQRLVEQLDSSLDRWLESIPDYLQWDPHRDDPLFFELSAALRIVYYYVQMQIHRPFIQKESPLHLSSLTVCTNAARACGKVLEIQFKRKPLAFPHVVVSAFTSGVVLLLSIWGGRKAGLSTYPSSDLAGIQSCMHVLKVLENQFHLAGRLWDMLNELASMNDPPPPKLIPPSNKRQREFTPPDPPSALSSGRPPLISHRSSNHHMVESFATHSAIPLQRDTTTYEQKHEYALPLASGPDIISYPRTYQTRPEAPGSRFIEYHVDAPIQSTPMHTLEHDNTLPFETTQSNNTALSMWMNAPAGFNVAEWDAYIGSMGGVGRT